jgi:hypothetical protein
VYVDEYVAIRCYSGVNIYMNVSVDNYVILPVVLV